MRVTAAVLHEPNARFAIEDLDLDEPRAGEVLVRVAASGVCHSDWHLVTGDTKHPMPCVAGHEGAGVVEAIGPGVSNVSVGACPELVEGACPELVEGDHVVLNW